MEKVKRGIKKICTKEAMFYVLFGAVTTVVNLISFYVFAEILKWNVNLSNFIAISLSIIVAYVTNKDMVFHSKAETVKEKIHEFIKFIMGRTLTLVLELVGGFILFRFPIPNIIIKILLTVIVIVLNYIISKFFVFKKKKDFIKTL